MNEHDELRHRLDCIVTAIDAGQYREPGHATQAILDTFASVYPAHQDQLLAYLIEIGFLTNPAEGGDVKDSAWFGSRNAATLHGKTMNDGLVPLYHTPIRPRR